MLHRVCRCTAIAFLTAAIGWAAPLLTVEEFGVEVELTPGGKVVLLGSQIHIPGSVPIHSYYAELLEDQDLDGWVAPELDREVAWQSLWIAIDRETGEVTVKTPEGYPLRLSDLPEDLGPGANSLRKLNRLGELLVVRPGHGAWVGHIAADQIVDPAGDADDPSGVDRLESLGESYPPRLTALGGNDIVVLLDHLNLSVAIGQIAQPEGE